MAKVAFIGLGVMGQNLILNIADHSMDVYVNKLTKWALLSAAEAQERREKTADPKG